jgi:hypothetical protein
MGKKIALNVLYNISIFLCVLGIIKSYSGGQYPYIPVMGFILVIVVVLKVKL